MQNDCPRGRVFAPFESRPGGMVLDETDTCIRLTCHVSLVGYPG